MFDFPVSYFFVIFFWSEFLVFLPVVFIQMNVCVNDLNVYVNELT